MSGKFFSKVLMMVRSPFYEYFILNISFPGLRCLSKSDLDFLRAY